ARRARPAPSPSRSTSTRSRPSTRTATRCDGGCVCRQQICDRQRPLSPGVRAPDRGGMTETTHLQPFDDHLAARLLHQRIVLVGAEIDDVVASRVTAQLLLLSAEDTSADISLYLNSPGGSIEAGLAVLDTMRLVTNAVSTVAVGFAGGTAQFVLTAGPRGTRSALPHARVVLHQPPGGVGGATSDVVVQAEHVRHLKDVMTRLQAEHTGQSVE